MYQPAFWQNIIDILMSGKSALFFFGWKNYYQNEQVG